MFNFSALEVELSYLIAKIDYTKLKIQKAKKNKQSTKELEKKLKFDQQLIQQLQTRINAIID